MESLKRRAHLLKQTIEIKFRDLAVDLAEMDRLRAELHAAGESTFSTPWAAGEIRRELEKALVVEYDEAKSRKLDAIQVLTETNSQELKK